MTTENTRQLPPCPLPDCGGGEHHFHDVEAYAAEKDKTHDCATHTRDGFRCYDPHRPGIPQWQPIEPDQIKAGMRIRVTSPRGDRMTTHVGVAHHQTGSCWHTEDSWPLAGWGVPTIFEADPATIFEADPATIFEADPATIPDPDAELIEKIGKAIHDADESAYTWGGDEWGEDPSAETYRKLARAALTVIRESEVEA